MSIQPDAVRSLSAQTLQTRLRSPRGLSEYAFKGVPLHDYAQHTGLLTSGPSANQYYVVTAGDGFKVALAMAEVAPGFSDKQVLLAYEQNGEPVRTGLRLVVPGDDLGGRSVFGVESIEVREVESVPLSAAPVSQQVALSGEIDAPGTFDVEGLGALEQRSVEPAPSKGHGDLMRPRRGFTGVRLFDLIESAGLQLDESLREPFLRKIIVARDRDGYAVVIAGGEIEPRFLAAPFTVALSDDSGPLGEDDGRIRLVPPFDLAGARHLKGLASLEVREA